MTAFLITMLVLYVMQFGMTCTRLVQHEYPRILYKKPIDDTLGLIITVGMAGWVIYLLTTT